MRVKNTVERAIQDLREGKFILIYDADGREEETDFVIGAEFIREEHVYRMRHDGGGLIFLMIHHPIAEKLGLPYLSDVLYKSASKWSVFKELIPNDIPYDTRSSFSIPINHRKTFTGITDRDRAMTMSHFALLAKEVEGVSEAASQRMFGERFRSPGHVPICIASNSLLKERKGHTELSVALAVMANIIPVATGCEMMDTKDSLPKKKAVEYAKKNGIPFLEGSEIVATWEKWQE
jgi:3,4-dihydroxy 2-butanone 4-phosphate synthase